MIYKKKIDQINKNQINTKPPEEKGVAFPTL